MKAPLWRRTGFGESFAGRCKNMYAIIECGGKQYRVTEGDLIRVEKLDAEVGSTVAIDKVLMLGGDRTEIGAPYVSGAEVVCKVMNHDKSKKILVFHYKAKKNVRKRYGHRQPYTSLLIDDIVTSGEQAAKTAAVPAEAAVEAEA
jgi:large subunit ribosomal protein L21